MASFTEDDSIVLAIFAGTGGVTACFKRHGFDNSVAVDKLKSAGGWCFDELDSFGFNKVGGPTGCDFLAATSSSSWRVFVALPCGTASAARSIEIPGENPQKPLRSFDQTDALSSLKGVDLLRVSAANILYAFTAEFLRNAVV